MGKFKEILSKVDINHDDIFLHLKIKIGDKVVHNERAHSLTMPFLWMLGHAFQDGSRYEGSVIPQDSCPMFLPYDSNDFPNENDSPQTFGAYVKDLAVDEITISTDGMSSTDENMWASAYAIYLTSSRASGAQANKGLYYVTAVDRSNEDIGTSTADSGSVDSISGNQIIDTGQNFTATVTAGDTIKNTDTNQSTNVVSVDDNETLTVGTQIFEVGDNFSIFNDGNEQVFTVSESFPDDTDEDGLIAYPLLAIRGDQTDIDLFRVIDVLIGDDNTSVEIDDLYPWQQFTNEFTNPPHTVDEPVIAASNSKIAITKAFTNQSGGSLTVREVSFVVGSSIDSDGYIIGASGGSVFTSYEGYAIPLARDVISDKSVADGETITITYEFTVSEDGQQGIMANFNELMYRQFTGLNRTVEDYNNQNETADDSEHTFSLTGGDEDQGDHDLSYAGIQLGSHNSNTVDIDDRNLNDGAGSKTRIEHGSEDGQLYYYGSKVSGVTKNSDTEAWLDVVGIFENRGSVSVDVNETGFNVMTNDQTTDGIYPVLISRHVLDVADQQTVAAGEFLKVTYRFTISTS